MQIENYDAAVEDFKQALSHAGCQIRDADIQALRQELKNSEEKASLERNKQKNFYTILGTLCAIIFGQISVLYTPFYARPITMLYKH